MIRMIQSTSAASAKSYFSASLAQSDYYINDQELQGKFHGKLAARLGFKEEASKEDFFALCENINPVDGTPLTPRTREERRVGYDINFHCPKSVSLVHALSKDDHIMEIFQESVKGTMQDIEQDMMTRVRKDGKYEDRKTGELIWADFTHQTARPVDGHAPDPHLHSHCFVFNATWDEQEQQIKAGQFGDIKRDMPWYQARFHKNLSDNLIKAGYQIRRTKSSFELVGVPQEVLDHFSKRTDEIGRIAREQGITDAKELDALGARTRAGKQKSLSMQELKTAWRNQIKTIHVEDNVKGEAPVRFAPLEEKPQLEPQKCVDHAVRHSFERASVMADRRILETAYRHALGHAEISVEQIDDTFSEDKQIIQIKDRGRIMCTTKEVLNEERRMVELAKKGMGAMAPLYSNAPSLSLTGQQKEAVSHVLTTKNRISIIRGAAGSGKTTLMKEAVTKIQEAGKKVIVVAPTAQASRGVLKEEGFQHADTVAQFLVNKKFQDMVKDQVLWVDEAGLLGTQDMKQLLEIATTNNARLILGGDTRQHASVVRGDALRILNTVGGIRTAEVNRIYRQRDELYRSAVEDLSKGDVKTGFEKLDTMGAIHETEPKNPNAMLVDDYVTALKKGKSALVISPTHKQGDKVTEDIRKAMRSYGMIGEDEITAKKLTNLNLTEAEKGDWRSFKPGQVIQFSQNVKGIKRGSQWKITDIEDQNILIHDKDGQTEKLPVNLAKRFDVFEQSQIGLSQGDRIHITRNGFDQENNRLNNGQSLEITSIREDGKIELVNPASKNTYLLDSEFGHISHSHCITSHASQGKTVDEVFISQPASTFAATNGKQFYVSVSRGRDATHIYTDDKTALLEHASELGDRHSAMELVNSKKDRHQDHVHQNLRTATKEKQPQREIAKTLEINKNSMNLGYEPEL
jgi:conjugative relaxase-like TrwC/TraI family protein